MFNVHVSCITLTAFGDFYALPFYLCLNNVLFKSAEKSKLCEY